MADASEDGERQERILRYWRAVEYFSPPTVDSVDPKKGIRPVFLGRPLPWQPGQLAVARKNYVWRHTVYAGIFDISKVREVLQNILRVPEDEQDFDGRAIGRSALLSFGIDSGGHLLKASITLSSCAWAVSRTLAPGPDSPVWLSGFDGAQEQLLAGLFGIGDGVIPIENGPILGSSGGRGLGLVAGTAARVALDVVTGGISALPSLIGMVAAPAVGPIAAKVIEKIGDALADDVKDTIKTKTESNDGNTDGDPGADDDETANPPPAVGEKVLTVDDLAAITRWVAESLGVAEALQPDAIRVKSYQIPQAAAEEVSTDDFLNSFYADDLEQVADAAATGESSAALTGFLQAQESIDMTRRVDVRESPDAVFGSVTPDSMPLGRWPTAPNRPLTVSQQFAINRICADLLDPAARGIYAVNGPPGTGKTTMLRDMIAALVVERATRLAKLKNPRDAFEKTSLSWEYSDGDNVWSRTLHPLRPNLTGFEIVVASSNNGAVENITLEVPAAKTIDLESFPEADYLADPATLATGTPCWGAIAARLGRRDFRREFVDRFWWGNGDRRKPQQDDLVGLRRFLMELENGKIAAALSWEEAVQRFEAAVAKVRSMARERQAVAELFAREGKPDAVLISLRDQAEISRANAARLRACCADAERQAEQAHAARVRAETVAAQARDVVVSAHARVDRENIHVGVARVALDNHTAAKPGFFRRLFVWHAMRHWREAAKPLVAALGEADRALRAAEAHHNECEGILTLRQRDLHEATEAQQQFGEVLSQCQRDLERAVAVLDAADAAVAGREAVLRQEAARLAGARREWPQAVPGAEWRAEPDDRDAMEQREKSAPWMDEDFAAARSRVFLAALDLHRAVLTAQPRVLRRSLQTVMDVVNGQAPAELSEETVLAAWQLLFFVVPVVSTTFASFSRMFGKLGREALGWLFVDEAGQAVPQAAVGALWRTQRAVVVGDPRQLEPFHTLPWTGQKRLGRQFDVDPQWVPQNRSVQSIADRVNVFGTNLPEPDGLDYTWVGSPLRVHRRCDRLMFEVSNTIAYDGMMVYGVPPRPNFDLLARNTWLDVHAQPGDDKWNELEGNYVLATLDIVRKRIAQQMDAELADVGSALPEWAVDDTARASELRRRVTDAVFVVSPFREIVDNLREKVGDRLLSEAKRLGTIHTTQGKEADIVILVLGTAKEQSGSRNWAAKTPNLLNVAVTRARRRLFVIGDYGNWSRLRNFRTLAQYGSGGADSLLTVVKADDVALRPM